MAIQSKDFRVGNWLQDTQFKKPFYVSALDIYEISKRENYDGLEPLPLTPEILKKCGFADYNSLPSEYPGEYDLRLYYIYEKSHYAYLSFKNNSLILIDGDGLGICIEKKYLHQLQNLYYALCGEELNVQIA